jgi:predicted nucleic acid-binding protein
MTGRRMSAVASRVRKTCPRESPKNMAGIRVLLDTGPLVAYLNRADQYHEWAKRCWTALHDPLWTCESVLSEAIFVLQSEDVGATPVLHLLELGIIRWDFTAAGHWPDLSRLIRKYADQPMSLADACLVRMAELTDRCQVFTTDRDFLVYRRKGRQVIPLLAPFAI